MAENAPFGEPYSILMIEDNPDNARIMRRVLERHAFTVLHAEDGETGIRLAFEAHPDLILLDLGLPDVDGHTIAGMLKQPDALPTIPIVVVTAWPSETARQLVGGYGCQGFIPKPIDTREFASQVLSYLSPAS